MIYLVTGGARSGKSRYGMELALSLSESPIYLATSRIWDEEFRERVDRHITDRDDRWELLESEKEIKQIETIKGRVVLVDCLTLWLTNYFVDNQQNIDSSLDSIKEELQKLQSYAKDVIIISNEIGMGLHADTESGRKFTDLQGWANQYVAGIANEVVFMVSGLPMFVKKHLDGE